MPNVLITGANRGIGLALVQCYLNQDWQVFACCRQPEQALKLQALANPDRLQIIELDICDAKQRDKLQAQLGNKKLDVVINNAGIYGPKGYSLDELDFAQWQEVMETNVFATTALTQTLLPSLKPSSKLAFLTSKMGSMSDNQSGGSYIYRSSKAALNAVVKSLSHDLAEQGVSVICLHPGWVQTEMGGPRALISAQQSAAGLVEQIAKLSPATSGCFVDYTGKAIAW